MKELWQFLNEIIKSEIIKNNKFLIIIVFIILSIGLIVLGAFLMRLYRVKFAEKQLINKNEELTKENQQLNNKLSDLKTKYDNLVRSFTESTLIEALYSERDNVDNAFDEFIL